MILLQYIWGHIDKQYFSFNIFIVKHMPSILPAFNRIILQNDKKQAFLSSKRNARSPIIY